MASLVEAAPAPGSWAEALERQPEGLAGAVLRKALVRRAFYVAKTARAELKSRAPTEGFRSSLLVSLSVQGVRERDNELPDRQLRSRGQR